MKLKEIINRDEILGDYTPNTISVSEFNRRKMNITEFVLKHLYEPVNNEGIKSIIFENFSELKRDLISIVKITPIEHLLNNGINKYYFNLILQYSDNDTILNILNKNRTIKEYYENKCIISIIKKDFK